MVNRDAHTGYTETAMRIARHASKKIGGQVPQTWHDGRT